MSQSPLQKKQQPLDTLQSMINGVLIDTGKALRSANRKGVKTIGHTHDRLQAFLPNAINKFHLALDDLESDIVRAKAVLVRDLRELQARQNQLDNPTVLQTENTSTSVGIADLQGAPSPHTAEAASSEPLAELQEVVKEEDITPDKPTTAYVSSPKMKHEGSSLSPALHSQVQVESQEALEKSTPETKTADIPAMDDAPKIADDPVNLAIAPGLGITVQNAVPSASSEAPAASGFENAIFESLFDAGGNGESELNFGEFDFTGNSTENQNHDFDGNGGEFDLSSFGNQAANNDGDPSSLLQGLDNFANGSGGDFNMLDLSNTADNQGAGETAVDDFGDLDTVLGESAFDDLMEFGDNAAGGDIMEHDEFTDAYFGLNSDA